MSKDNTNKSERLKRMENLIKNIRNWKPSNEGDAPDCFTMLNDFIEIELKKAEEENKELKELLESSIENPKP